MIARMIHMHTYARLAFKKATMKVTDLVFSQIMQDGHNYTVAAGIMKLWKKIQFAKSTKK